MRIPVSCVGGLKDAAQIKYLIENEYVDTVDVARAILADPNFANAVINGTDFAKCFGCKQCQYGPFTAHKCPALTSVKVCTTNNVYVPTSSVLLCKTGSVGLEKEKQT